MEIPLLDLKKQYATIKNEIDEAIKNVVDEQSFILSDEVSTFEKEIAEYCGTEYAVGVASGTDAILLSLKAAGVGEGDAVITTPFTFFATAEVVSILGARPAFVDIDPGTYNMDPDALYRLLKGSSRDEKKRIKAVIPVHLYGQCADMERILDIAKEFDINVVEDCAQAIGALHSGRSAGSFGIAGALSFFPSKNLGGFGDGGMVVTSDPSIRDAIKKLRVHGSDKRYIHEEIGYNSRLDSIQAAVLRVKLSKLDTWLEARRAIAAKYDKAFSARRVEIPVVMDGNVHTYHQYTIRSANRNEVVSSLNDNGIASRVYYPVPLHLQPCYKDLGYTAGMFPSSEKAADEVFSIPVYPELTEEETDLIIKNVLDIITVKPS